MNKAMITPPLQVQNPQVYTPIAGDVISFGVGYIEDGTPYIVISIIREGQTLAYYGVDIKHGSDLLMHINTGLSDLISNVINSMLPTNEVQN
jgi:hypothetical protein